MERQRQTENENRMDKKRRKKKKASGKDKISIILDLRWFMRWSDVWKIILALRNGPDEGFFVEQWSFLGCSMEFV